MALTNDDKQWIKEAIVEGVNGALETIVLPRFDAVEADISELKRDVSGLKEDVFSLKSDMREVKGRLERVEGELQALTNDIKEIYDVIYNKPNKTLMSASFAKMSSKEKLLVINEEWLKIAKDTGVVLPR